MCAELFRARLELLAGRGDQVSLQNFEDTGSFAVHWATAPGTSRIRKCDVTTYARRHKRKCMGILQRQHQDCAAIIRPKTGAATVREKQRIGGCRCEENREGQTVLPLKDVSCEAYDIVSVLIGKD